jgi:hypothetical protein
MAISVGNTATSAALTAATGTSSNLSLNNDKTDILVGVALRDTATAATATATYGGESMTVDIMRLREDVDSEADLRCYVFRRQQAKTGTNNVTVTLNVAADYWAIFAIAVSGLHSYGQPEVTGGADADATAATSPSVTLTTLTADTLGFDVVYNKAGTSMTAGSGQTLIGQVNVNGGSDRALAGYIIYTTAGSKTSTWTETAPDDWCMVRGVYRLSTWKPIIMVTRL